MINLICTRTYIPFMSKTNNDVNIIKKIKTSTMILVLICCITKSMMLISMILYKNEFQHWYDLSFLIICICQVDVGKLISIQYCWYRHQSKSTTCRKKFHWLWCFTFVKWNHNDVIYIDPKQGPPLEPAPGDFSPPTCSKFAAYYNCI